jgi:hypothetical protein
MSADREPDEFMSPNAGGLGVGRCRYESNLLARRLFGSWLGQVAGIRHVPELAAAEALFIDADIEYLLVVEVAE